VFFSALTGNPIDMGGGRREFWIDVSGSLVEER